MSSTQQPPPLPPRRRNSLASSDSSFSFTSDNEVEFQAQPRTNTVHLTPYTVYAEDGSHSNHPYMGGTGLDDPRSSSTQSLRPVESAGGRRKLLVVYIHGFMGTETSFKSFPAHVHTLLAVTLADTHVVHTKIYPRYQSRKNVSYARDAFSNWLTPHESDNTDVILIGHSLGGILAAEVVLLPTHRPGSNDLFQHRILGHIAFDTPFLGMHPGVVSTGIASLFKSAPDPPEAPRLDSASHETVPLSIDPFAGEPSDPNYNPAYDNDVVMANRKGKLDQAFYFLNKHYGEWRKAATSYVKSHLEFGGCLADYDGLKKRYNAFRPLEDIDELADKRTTTGKVIPRVRFVNYYTASTGRVKPQQPPSNNQKILVAETEMVDRPSLSISRESSEYPASNPRIALSEHGDAGTITRSLDEVTLHDDYSSDSDQSQMQHIEPQAEPPSPPLGETKYRKPVFTEIDTDGNSTVLGEDVIASLQLGSQSSDSQHDSSSNTTLSNAPTLVSDLSLPPLPDPPQPPPPFEPPSGVMEDPAMLKLAQREHERLVKSYERSKKDYEKTVKEREKYLASIEKSRKKQEEKKNKELSCHEKRERERLRKEEERMQKEKERLERGMQSVESKRASTLNQEQFDAALARQTAEEEDRIAHEADLAEEAKQQAKAPKPPKKLRDRKFCTLPKKDKTTGLRDATWIRVYMENMDEVVAHTSLFFVSETYAKLVGDTAERIESWVREAATIQAVREAQEWEKGAP